MAQYELVNDKMVRANVMQGEQVMLRRGSMLAYKGQVTFEPTMGTSGGVMPTGGMGGGMPMGGGMGGMGGGMGGGGGMPGAMGGMGGMAGGMAGRMVRQAQGEDVPLMAATPHSPGEILFGRAGLHCTIVQLQGEQLTVEASNILCYDGNLQAGTMMLGGGGGGGVGVGQPSGGGRGGLKGMLRGAATGVLSGRGLFTTQITGMGTAVILSHGGTVELSVGPGSFISVDPEAFIATRGNVQVELKVAAGWRDAVGKGSGEARQLQCQGQGTVYVQASEQKF